MQSMRGKYLTLSFLSQNAQISHKLKKPILEKARNILTIMKSKSYRSFLILMFKVIIH